MRIKKLLLFGSGALAAVAAALAVLVYALTYHPQPMEPVAVLGGTNAPVLKAGQKLRILSWNVQYLAGKNYLFWYETPAGYQAPVAERPSREDIARRLAEVARIITEEKPDIVLLQELDDGSKRTDYMDQLIRLLERLPTKHAPECCRNVQVLQRRIHASKAREHWLSWHSDRFPTQTAVRYRVTPARPSRLAKGKP